jgi:hypothetical protein
MAEYLHDDLIAAGINPESVIFGGNPDLAVGSSSTVTKNLSSGLSVIAKHQTANGTLTNKPLEKFLDANEVAAAPIPKCPYCNKAVYKAEEILFASVPWHKECFLCGGLGDKGCRRILHKGEYEQHSGHPYCTACFTHLFQLGAARGTVLDISEKQNITNKSAAQVDTTPEPKLSIVQRVAALQNKISKE